MATIVPVTDLTHPGLTPYARLTERQLRSKRDPEEASRVRRFYPNFYGKRFS